MSNLSRSDVKTIFLTCFFSYFILFHPFILFNLYEFKILLKYPLFVVLFAISSVFYIRASRLYISFVSISLFFLTIFLIRYDFQTGLALSPLFFVTLFSVHIFNSLSRLLFFLNIYTFCGVIICFHAISQSALVYSGLISIFPLSYDTSFGTFNGVNLLIGVINSTDPTYFRPSSFFTEANRLGYFLLPLIFSHFTLNSPRSNFYIIRRISSLYMPIFP